MCSKNKIRMKGCIGNEWVNDYSLRLDSIAHPIPLTILSNFPSIGSRRYCFRILPILFLKPFKIKM